MLLPMKNILVFMMVISSLVFSTIAASETEVKPLLINYYQSLATQLESVAPGQFNIKTDTINLQSLSEAELQELIADMEELFALFPAPQLSQKLYYGALLLGSPVEGVGYQTDSHTGMTGNNGQFIFKTGETVTFSIGDIQLGQVTMGQSPSGSTVITAQTLANTATNSAEIQHNIETNITLLLYALDSDGNPENGITISELARLSAVGATTVEVVKAEKQFVQNPELIQLVATTTGVDVTELSLGSETDGQGVADQVTDTATTVVSDDPDSHNFAVSGHVMGLNAGETAHLLISSQSLELSRMTSIQGNGGDTAFILDDLPAAADYRLQVQSENHPDGYWGGITSGEVAVLVNQLKSTTLDLSNHSISALPIQLVAGYPLSVTLAGVNPGDIFAISAWSASESGFAWQQLTAMDTTITAILTGLPAADDYRISIDSPTEGVRGGFYTGENQPPGSFLKATPLSLTGDRTIVLTISRGYSISGTLSNLTEGNRAHIEAWSKETSEHGTVMVSSNGLYTIQGLAPVRDYIVCVESDEQAGGCYAGSTTNITSQRIALPIDLRAGIQTGIDLTLGLNRSISGTVSGLAAPEVAWVEAWSTSTSHLKTTLVNHDDTYKLTGLHQADDYQVTVTVEGYQNPRAVPVNLSETTTSIANFNLIKGGKIAGSIVGLVAGEVATVEIRSHQRQEGRETTLVAVDGAALPYVVTGLAAADDYIVRLKTAKGSFYYHPTIGTQRGRNQASIISIQAGADRDGIDFNITMAVSYRLSGTIQGLTETDDSLMITLTAWGEEDGFATTQRIGNGSWTLSGLPEGNYYILVSLPRYVDQLYSGSADGTLMSWSHQYDAATTLTLNRDRQDLQIDLTSGHTLTGTLTDPQADAIANIYVNVWDSGQSVGGGITTLADGSFEITGLPAGSYVVEAISVAGRMQQTISLDQDSDLGIITLEKAAGILQGTTTAAGMVFVYDDQNNFVGATVADHNGTYQIEGLEVDVTYRVDVDIDGDYSAMEFSGNATPTMTTPLAQLDLAVDNQA